MSFSYFFQKWSSKEYRARLIWNRERYNKNTLSIFSCLSQIASCFDVRVWVCVCPCTKRRLFTFSFLDRERVLNSSFLSLSVSLSPVFWHPFCSTVTLTEFILLLYFWMQRYFRIGHVQNVGYTQQKHLSSGSFHSPRFSWLSFYLTVLISRNGTRREYGNKKAWILFVLSCVMQKRKRLSENTHTLFFLAPNKRSFSGNNLIATVAAYNILSVTWLAVYINITGRAHTETHNVFNDDRVREPGRKKKPAAVAVRVCLFERQQSQLFHTHTHTLTFLSPYSCLVTLSSRFMLPFEVALSAYFTTRLAPLPIFFSFSF